MQREDKGRRWRSHVEAAEAQGKSLGQYAQEQGIARSRLYETRAAMRRAAAAAPAKLAKPATFVAVKVMGSPAKLQVRLPNGVQLVCEQPDAVTLSQLIDALGALPCSA
jgi:hypothetical protein